MEERFPELVKEASRIMPVQKIAEILQRLVSEDIGAQPARRAGGADRMGPEGKDSVLLAEYAHRAQAPHQPQAFERTEHPAGPCWRPMSRKPCAAPSARPRPAAILALDPAAGKALLENIKRTVGDLGNAVQKPVLLTSMDIRRYLRKMIEQDLYERPCSAIRS